ncbi:MAG: S-methyl-5-thioribose-1-phosphate isomerase [Bacteroidetes bacterium]|nr:S-methyl-5-thioribose-1-phosphate isomerase [Rhodothermia bacterium]MCS7155273.1 S-methyl-5-thioribose-1-phosphate isomerase [Bacteroidota bacterium]MCX7907858.1 S-methyl-5-thioribose-1-phosphate isomerase [Bacteroidota bacterium]MDW8138677.1 S-methyl-5-thioribose-1-phosphate isomerase [Bacteroidota bacterium]MDW8284737.1 S-methyl-5-thioribose-1-phosphate isomerase [Bacteroidota bacterium]
MTALRPLIWTGTHLEVLDQTFLPQEERWLKLGSIEDVWEAIRSMRVRGAPAIGMAAAFGLYLGVRERRDFWTGLEEAIAYLSTARPTAVNLRWALERLRRRAEALRDRPTEEIKQALLEEALRIQAEDEAINRRIGEHGLSLLRPRARVLTHCNTGALATSAYGTALAPILLAQERGWAPHVWVDETRPHLQGARLTSFELERAGISYKLIVDSAAAYLMQQGQVDLVIVGADRVTAQGDVANKIGTYALAVLARAHRIPFYVAVPTSSIDFKLRRGSEIPIEERPAEELTHIRGVSIAPACAPVYNPAFDVTPARLITAFITERGILRPPYRKAFADLRQELMEAEGA